MRNVKIEKLFFILIFSALFSVAVSEEVVDLPREKSSSFEGVHFYVSFMQNEWRVLNPGLGVEQKLFISGKYDSKISVFYPLENRTRNYEITKDSVMVLEIDPNMQLITSERIDDKVLEIKSDSPITVYGFSSQQNTSDSWALIPTMNWGYNYMVVSMPNDQYAPEREPSSVSDSLNVYASRRSQFAVIAAFDGTEVRILPRYETHNGREAGEEFIVILDKGEVYQVKSKETSKGAGDLTGTTIRSNKPIGVLSGHERSSVPVGLDVNRDSKDHLIEMLMPQNSWGKKFITVPFGLNPFGDLFKATSFDNNTTVKITNSLEERNFDFNNINVFELRNLAEPTVWESNNPIQLAQFMMRSNDNESLIESYDPCMVMIPPVEQFVSRVNFQTPGNVFRNPNQYDKHFVYVVVDEVALDYLLLDGVLLDTISPIRSQRIRSTDLYWLRTELNAGKHTLEAEEGRFSGVLFGSGIFDSYGMVLGASLNPVGIDDNVPPEINVIQDCYCLSGTITDQLSQTSFGMKYAIIEQESTFNYDTNIEPFEPGDEAINFEFCVIDKKRNANLVLLFEDLDGNAREFRYNYLGTDYEVSQDINFGTIGWENSLCDDVIIENNGNADIVIDDVSVLGDTRINLEIQEPLPFTISRGESFTVTVCFVPERDSTILDATLRVSMNNSCEIEDIALNGTVKAVEVIAVGYDFGDNLVGTESCDVIKITNLGNEPVTIEDIQPAIENNDFTIDKSALPYDLQPGEEMEIPACFLPDSRGLADIDFIITNSEEVALIANLRGVGLAPELTAENIDWGEKRVGTRNEEVWNVYNLGDFATDFFFESFILNPYTDELTQALEDVSLDLEAGENAQINLYFTPQNVGEYTVVAQFTSTWEFQEPIEVTFTGIGTLPEITTFNFNFGDVNIYSQVEESVKIFETSGNENLTVDEIFVIDGDVDAFEMDLASYQNEVIDSGLEIFERITFSPTRIGTHELVLGIRNDAMPNYERRVDTIVITANSIPEPNTDFEFSVNSNDILACNSEEISFEVRNTGNTQVDITSIAYQTDYDPTMIVNVVDLNDYSETLANEGRIVLEIGETLTLNYQVSSTAGDFVDFTHSVTLFGDQTITHTERINVIKNEIEIDPMASIITQIGNTFKIKFTGNFPNNNEIGTNFNTELTLDNFFAKLLTENSILYVTDNEGVKTYQLNVEQETDIVKISYNLEDIVLNGSGAVWEFELEFLQLLDNKRDEEIVLNVNSDLCFVSSSENYLIETEEICNFDLRNIKISGNLNAVQMYPNPVSDFVNVTLYSKQEYHYSFDVFDINGVKLKTHSETVPKGKFDLSFDVSEFVNGTYTMNINNGFEIYNLIFVIIK